MANPTSLVEDHLFIASSDPALESEAEGFTEKYQRWLETGDPALLSEITLPGKTPVLYAVRHPRGRLRLRVKGAYNRLVADSNYCNEEGLWDSVKLCLQGVEGLTTVEGKEVEVLFEYSKEDRQKVVSEESMNWISDIAPVAINEMGLRIFKMLMPSAPL